MHFSDEEEMDLFKLIAGIMHMGEMKFKQRPREEQAECENQAGSLIGFSHNERQRTL